MVDLKLADYVYLFDFSTSFSIRLSVLVAPHVVDDASGAIRINMRWNFNCSKEVKIDTQNFYMSHVRAAIVWKAQMVTIFFVLEVLRHRAFVG